MRLKTIGIITTLSFSLIFFQNCGPTGDLYDQPEDAELLKNTDTQEINTEGNSNSNGGSSNNGAASIGSAVGGSRSRSNSNSGRSPSSGNGFNYAGGGNNSATGMEGCKAATLSLAGTVNVYRSYGSAERTWSCSRRMNFDRVFKLPASRSGTTISRYGKPVNASDSQVAHRLLLARDPGSESRNTGSGFLGQYRNNNGCQPQMLHAGFRAKCYFGTWMLEKLEVTHWVGDYGQNPRQAGRWGWSLANRSCRVSNATTMSCNGRGSSFRLDGLVSRLR